MSKLDKEPLKGKSKKEKTYYNYSMFQKMFRFDKKLQDVIVYALADTILFTIVHISILFLEKQYNILAKKYNWYQYDFSDESYLVRFKKAFLWNVVFLGFSLYIIYSRQYIGRTNSMLVFINIIKFLSFELYIQKVKLDKLI